MNSIKAFSDFKLNKQLLLAIEELGFKEPTKIQKKAIPLALNGHDILGIAQTGTGKTAAYLLPLLMKVKFAQGINPRGLILAPTRELVLQIEEHARKISNYCDLRIGAVYGGVGIKPQIEMVSRGLDILVATPGRLLDTYKSGELILKEIKTLVLDEADKIMDMGFMPQIRRILEIIPVKRQNLLFSATMPERVVELSYEFLDFPIKVEVTPQASTVNTISQELYYIENFKAKIDFLGHLLSSNDLSKVIVFVKTKSTANNLYKYLSRIKIGEVRVMHSNKDQNSRLNAINAFREGIARVLVSTDVSARGLDISRVSHVINFDVPLVYEDYVHRVGRTGRAKNEGIAITMANPAEVYHISKIENLINKKIPLKKLPKDISVDPTPFDEHQLIAREIDKQRKKEDPSYKGAFHPKKKKLTRYVNKKRKR